LDEGTGTITADTSGNNHNGTFVGGVSWVSPGVMDDSAIHIDGSPLSKVSIGTWNPAEGTGKLTLAIWVKWAGPYNTGGQPQGLICKRDGWSASQLMFTFEMDTPDSPAQRGTFAFRSFTTSVYSPTNIMTLFINQWAHLAATFDGTTARLYLNGREVASGPFTFSNKTAAGIVIANNQMDQYWGPGVFNGDMDEARIYNRALSPAEIAYLADTTPEDGQIYTPLPSIAELYDAEAKGSRAVNLKDFAILADYWLQEQLWPF
jgi:hypothetical protein